MPRPLDELEKRAAAIGKTIATALPPDVCFLLMVFDVGEGGHLTYLSNANREDVMAMLREFLQKQAH